MYITISPPDLAFGTNGMWPGPSCSTAAIGSSVAWTASRLRQRVARACTSLAQEAYTPIRTTNGTSGSGLHAMGRRHWSDTPQAFHTYDPRGRHGHVLESALDIPVLQLYQPQVFRDWITLTVYARYGSPSPRALFTEVNFQGFDHTTLTDLTYMISGSSSLVTIYADLTRTLPHSGITESQCFYNCEALVGGYGATWSRSNVGYMYMRIDKAGHAKYLTSALIR